MEIVLKGEDKYIRIHLRDDDGKKVPVSDFTGLLVYLVYKETNGVLDKFSINTKQNFKDVNVVNDTDGIIEVYLQSDVTANGDEGSVYYELKASEDDTNFNDGNFFTAYQSPVIFNLVDGVSEGENPE